jgi:vancomycin resistance protein YoaR
MADEAFSHLWSGFSTSLAGRSAEQRRNAALAGQALDGAIIAPGAVFSFNERVGARDRAKGFVPAPNLNADGILEEAPGGGICQLASTIYNVGLLGGLEVVERHPHSRAVAHVPPGRDATIATWRKDLKLRNPFRQPLLLRITSDDNRLTASLRSTSDRDFQVEIHSEQIPLEPDSVAGHGSGKGQAGGRGFSTITRRITRKNGIETNELLSEDVYPPPTRIIAGGGR